MQGYTSLARDKEGLFWGLAIGCVCMYSMEKRLGHALQRFAVHHHWWLFFVSFVLLHQQGETGGHFVPLSAMGKKKRRNYMN